MNILDAFRETVISIREWAEGRFNELGAQIEDLHYKPIDITSFSHSAGVCEIGSTLDTVTLSWKINKTPTTLTLDPACDAVLSLNSSGSVSLPGIGLTSSATWKLTAKDERDAIATKSTTVNFYNGVYYGSISATATIDNDTILALGKSIRGSRAGSFKTTRPSQRGIFVCPTTYGTPQFKIGEMPLPYTWEKVNDQPFMLANQHGYIYEHGYDIWRSYQDISAKDTNITVI